MQLDRRVTLLEGGTKHSTIGDMLDAMAEVEVGGTVDWSSITASPALLRTLDQIGEGEGAWGASMPATRCVARLCPHRALVSSTAHPESLPYAFRCSGAWYGRRPALVRGRLCLSRV